MKKNTFPDNISFIRLEQRVWKKTSLRKNVPKKNRVHFYLKYYSKKTLISNAKYTILIVKGSGEIYAVPVGTSGGCTTSRALRFIYYNPEI